MFDSIINSQLCSSIALTLIHFLWQGLVVAVVLKSALMVTAKQHSRLRYLFSSLAMMANFILPFITFAIIYQPEHLIDIQQNNVITNNLLGLSLLVNESSLNADLLLIFPYLTIAWLSTVLCLCGKMIFQMFSVNQLPKHQSPLPYIELNARFSELVDKLNLRKVPQLIVSLSVDVPMAIGWLKPVVLLPASMITSLTPAQLDMLLLHELAHIRRHDYLINLIQSFVEIILFFHPAVFWVSKQMRIEREYCSDDIAVQHCGDALAYAHTLTDTASLCSKHRHAIPAMAMAASGGDLKERVLRLVNHHSCTTAYDKSKWLASVIIVASFIMLTSKELGQLHNFDISNSANQTSLPPVLNQLETVSRAQSQLPQSLINTELDHQAKNTIEQAPVVNTVNPIEQAKVAINSELALAESTLVQLNNKAEISKTTIASKPNATLNSPQEKTKPNHKVTKPSVSNNLPVMNEKKPTTVVAADKKPAVKKVVSNQNNTQALVPAQSTNRQPQVANSQAEPLKLPTKLASADDSLTLKSAPEQTVLTSLAQPAKQDFYTQEVSALSQPLKHDDVIDKFERQQKTSTPQKNTSSELIEEKNNEVSYQAANVIKVVDPKYPSWALRKKIELDLLVNFTINKNGNVRNIQIEEKSKATYFNNSIIKAIEQWKFLPAKKNGQPVESTMSKIFSFNFNDFSY